jgi:hypothetical protein
MAGYKMTALRYKPTCCITFDGESNYDYQGYLRVPQVYDSSGFDNHGVMLATNQVVKPYGATTSLLPRESGYDQYSMCFSPRGHDTNMSFPYDAARVEVFSSNSIDLETDFTISFLFNKKENDGWFQNAIYDPVTNTYKPSPSSTGKTIRRTIFQKGLQVGLVWVNPWASPDYLEVSFPTGTQNIAINGANADVNTNRVFRNFYDRTFHITMTCKVNKIGTNLFQIVEELWVDGIIILSRKGNVTSNPSLNPNTASFMIGGNNSTFDPFYCNDRQTSPLFIDNFLVYDRCLSNDEIASLYKKVFDYDVYTKRWYPLLYAQMGGENLNPNQTANNGVLDVNPSNNCVLTYFGNQTQVKNEVGPKRLINESAIEFKDLGMARISNTYTSPVINSSGDYTLEFFAKFSSTERGVIFSAQTDYFPYKGILVEGNVFADQHQVGSLQVTLEDGIYINTKGLNPDGSYIQYNDGEFHHYVVIRRGNKFEFWIDGYLIETKYGNAGNMITSFGSIYLMGMMPEKQYIYGSMCQLAYYDYAMQEHNIRAKAFFFTRVRMKGRVTLQGVPHGATIRIMDHTTGKFLTEGMCDGSTGLYDIDVYTDHYIDIMVFDKFNPNVRYRAFGPDRAEEFTDIDGTIC